MSYREYFDIDPEYFPQVDKHIIETQPDLWKKFYPHPSFVSLLNSVVGVLTRKQKLSLWVDGAYGTGKSHAVLTLKKLLEASNDEVTEYFNSYNLDPLFCKSFIKAKEGNILVCHRYGSSDISSDTDLIVAIQEEVENALTKAGIENKANTSLKTSLIRYFENTENKQSFDIYAKGTYKDILGGDTADDILKKLKTYNDDALRSLINKIFKVQSVKGSFSMNVEELCDWIKEVIAKNNLKELIFIWDEFSEYFENNMHHLTGFQQIAEISASAPFCLLIVAHKSGEYFSDKDPDKKKILDRFDTPIHISLPENIAFELMGQAMKITDDEVLAAKWVKNKDSLDGRTMQSRKAVKQAIKLSDKDLSNVLPIHPYAALILQHISIYYTSTARSMFNFIKNDEGDEVQAFQWFIDNNDFSSQNPFITVDMLWSFFYDKGKDKLTNNVKEILNCYTSKFDKDLIEPEKRVLKTILLLQAIADNMKGDRNIFLPNNKNLTLAFEGTDLEIAAIRIAEKLLRDHVVTRTPLSGEVFSYCCKNIGTFVDSTPFISTAKAKSTKDMTFVPDSDLRDFISLTGKLKARYLLSYSTISDFDSELKKANNPSEINNKIYAVAVISRDQNESAVIKKKISDFYKNNLDTEVVVIDATETVLGENEYEEFIQNYAMALAIGQSDITQRKTYDAYANEVLKKWAQRIKSGAFYVYSRFAHSGDRAATINDLYENLFEIDKCYYPKCLEGEYTNVIDTMYDSNMLAKGVSCGVLEETSSTYRSANEITKLENALKEAWKIPEYWKTSKSYIADLKNAVDELIEREFNKGERVAFSTIYNFLSEKPYGFMPCNFTAFIIGFILKEYVRNGNYSYSDELTTVPLDENNLCSMVSDAIKQINSPNKHYREKYIVTLTKEERTFNKVTSTVFGIPEQYCVSVTETRSRIRESMKTYTFPIWLIEYAINDVEFITSKEIVTSVINNYCGIANNMNIEGNQSDTDIALKIGRICIENPDVVEDFKKVLTKDNCKKGMLEYLKSYNGGLLPLLADKIGDNGQYINHLAYKFSSDAANWVWNRDTVNSKIDEIITEYEIIETSNRIFTKNITYRETMRAWCEKLSQIGVAYSIVKNELGESKDFYEILYHLKIANSLLDSQKKNFLELLRKNLDHFKNFMATQHELLFNCCSIYLTELNSDDVKAILEDDKFELKNTYTVEPNVYISRLKSAVDAYKASIGYMKLRRHWKALTGTESPMDWSDKYNMPISIMVPDEELAIARKYFEIINKKSKNNDLTFEADDYISKITYLDELNSEKAREKAFRTEFLKDYSLLFDDVEELKSYLKQHVTDIPYYWNMSKQIFSLISSIASSKYAEVGYAKVKRVIDDMPAEQVKDYLKQLIQNNINVGVEIMKNHNQ